MFTFLLVWWIVDTIKREGEKSRRHRNEKFSRIRSIRKGDQEITEELSYER